MRNHETEREFTSITEDIFKAMLKEEEKGVKTFSRQFFEGQGIDELARIFLDYYDSFKSHYADTEIVYAVSMLRHYFRQKLPLYKLLGSVRISKDVEVEQDLNSFINSFKGALRQEREVLRRQIEGVGKEEAIDIIKKVHYIEIVLNGSLFSGEFNALYDNYSTAHEMKVSKVFATLFGPDNIITTTYSNLTQNNTLKETVYISISPLDYLTMSENSYSWQSCLRIDGEWGGGSQSYIMDNSTVVSFIGNYRETFIGLDKKWRQLIYLQHNGDFLSIAQSRQYPSKINTIEEAVRRMLFSRINDYVGENLSYERLDYVADYFSQESSACHYYDLNNDHHGNTTSHEKIAELEGMNQVGNIGICLSCGESMSSNEHCAGYTCGDCS